MQPGHDEATTASTRCRARSPSCTSSRKPATSASPRPTSPSSGRRLAEAERAAAAGPRTDRGRASSPSSWSTTRSTRRSASRTAPTPPAPIRTTAARIVDGPRQAHRLPHRARRHRRRPPARVGGARARRVGERVPGRATSSRRLHRRRHRRPRRRHHRTRTSTTSGGGLQSDAAVNPMNAVVHRDAGVEPVRGVGRVEGGDPLRHVTEDDRVPHVLAEQALVGRGAVVHRLAAGEEAVEAAHAPGGREPQRREPARRRCGRGCAPTPRMTSSTNSVSRTSAAVATPGRGDDDHVEDGPDHHGRRSRARGATPGA